MVNHQSPAAVLEYYPSVPSHKSFYDLLHTRGKFVLKAAGIQLYEHDCDAMKCYGKSDADPVLTYYQEGLSNGIRFEMPKEDHLRMDRLNTWVKEAPQKWKSNKEFLSSEHHTRRRPRPRGGSMPRHLYKQFANMDPEVLKSMANDFKDADSDGKVEL